MDLDDMITDCADDSRRWFPLAQTPENQVLFMVGELGEVANIVKKVTRGSITWEQALDPNGPYDLAEEVVDVLIYLCNFMGNEKFRYVDWVEVWEKKRHINEERFGKERNGNWTEGYVPEQRRHV